VAPGIRDDIGLWSDILHGGRHDEITGGKGVTTMSLSVTAKLAGWCAGIAVATLPLVSTPAQVAVVPRTFHLEKLTCAELLSVSSERQDRVLIYFDGYLAGMRRQTTWDERVEGEMIDRAMGYCKADPTQTVLSSFMKAAPR